MPFVITESRGAHVSDIMNEETVAKVCTHRPVIFYNNNDDDKGSAHLMSTDRGWRKQVTPKTQCPEKHWKRSLQIQTEPQNLRRNRAELYSYITAQTRNKSRTTYYFFFANTF